MNRLYILDTSKPFDGSVQNTMPFVDRDAKNGMDILRSTYVDYSDMTFAEYNKSHGGNLEALTWDELYSQYYEPYYKSLQGEFLETTEEMFWDGLECLPPKRWTRFTDGEFFFVGECFTDDLYSCYVRKGEKYYNALRSIKTKPEDLIELKNIIQ